VNKVDKVDKCYDRQKAHFYSFSINRAGQNCRFTGCAGNVSTKSTKLNAVAKRPDRSSIVAKLGHHRPAAAMTLRGMLGDLMPPAVNPHLLPDHLQPPDHSQARRLWQRFRGTRGKAARWLYDRAWAYQTATAFWSWSDCQVRAMMDYDGARP
jgi:hypothetical protein